MEPHHHPHQHQHQQQQQAPVPPQWYGPAPPYHQQQQQPLPFGHHFPPRAPPPPHPHAIPPPWPPAAPDYTPAGVPPAPHPHPYSHPPPPYPSPPPPRYPPSFSPIPPPPQAWGTSPWHQQQGWDHPDRSLAYSNEDDWAARARAWAESKSVTESHSSMSFNSAGRMEVQNHFYDDPTQQTVGHSRDSQQPPVPATHHLPYSVTDYQKQASHLQESSQTNLDSYSYVADTHASYNSRPESLVSEQVNGPSPQVNFSSNSSIFEQEVPSSYSSISGRENEDQYEWPEMALQSPVLFSQGGNQTSQPMPPFQPTPIKQPHVAYGHQLAASSDASDQPLVFDQRHTVDHRKNQNHITGAMGDVEHMEAAIPSHPWTPSVAFSQTAAVTSVQQFDSSYGNLPMAAGDPALVFGRISAPSFPPNIPPNIPAVSPFGLGSGAPLHPSTTFSEDANGVFGHVERPKKPSVPNWLREELKKKASIASSAVEQPTIVSRSIGDHDDDRSFGKSEQVSKGSELNKSDDDDEDKEDDAEAARLAAINQEIKRILTDILLKVTDELFEEVATKVINEEDLSVEVDNSVTATKVSSQASVTPRTAARVILPLQGNSENVSNIKNSTVSLEGNLLGLANYNSDDDEEEPINSSTVLSVRMIELSHHTQKDSGLKDASETVKNSTNEEKNIVLPQNGAKDAVRSGSVTAGIIDESISEQSNRDETKESRGARSRGKPVLTHTRANDGQSAAGEARDLKGKSVSSSRHPDGHIISDDATKDAKCGRVNEKFIAGEHKGGGTGDRGNDKLGKQDSFQRTSKGHGSRKRDSEETDLDDNRGNGKDKKNKPKDDDDRKNEQAKKFREERYGQGERHSHRSKNRRSPSPDSRPMNSKENSISCHGITSSGETPEDSKNRRSHSIQHSFSRSPPRSRRRQVSRSPHRKHSQRRHSPYSYSEKRRRSRSASPGHRRR